MSHPAFLGRNKDRSDCVLYVARLDALCLTGITVDTTTDVRVGKDNEQPPPPEQMRAVLAVVRNSETHGISSRSKRLQKIKEAEEGQINRHHRFVAVWNKRKNRDESLSFEAKLSLTSRNDHNFDLIIGLTSGNSGTITPIGTAILPMAEAVRMHNSIGAVVLDLPVFNFTSLTVDPFAKPPRGALMTRVLSQRRLAPSRKAGKERSQTFGQRQKKKALGYDYFIYPSAGAALLRIELEVHEKEGNFEVGLDSDQQSAKRDIVLTHSMDSKEKNHTDTHQIMEPSIERVFSPMRNRRFRVTVNEGTNSLESSPKSTVMDETFETFDSDVHVDDEAKAWALDSAIERVLSDRHLDESAPQVSGSRLIPPRVPKASSREKSRRFASSLSFAPELTEKTRKVVRSGPFVRFRGMGKNRAFNAGRSRNVTSIYGTKPSLVVGSSCDSVEEVFSSVDGRPQSSTSGTDCSKSVVSSVSSNPTVAKWAAQQKQPLQQMKPIPMDIPDVNTKSIATKTKTPTVKYEEDQYSTPQRVAKALRTSPGGLESSVHGKSRASMSVASKASGVQSLSSSRFAPLVPQESAEPPIALAKATSIVNENGEDWKVEAIVDYVSNQPTVLEKTPVVPSLIRPVVASPRRVVPSPTRPAVPPPPGPAASPPRPVASKTVVVPSPKSLVSTVESRYSTSLPNFSEDDEPAVAILKEMYDDISVVAEKIPAQQESVNGAPPEEVEAQNRSLRSYFSLVDIQPCSGKLEGLLRDKGAENDTITDSWTANDNSTTHTNKLRSESFRDDLAEIGLFLGELCRPIDARTAEENSMDETDSCHNDANDTVRNLWGNGGMKQRWMSAMNISQFLDGDDQDTFHTEHTRSEGTSWAEGTVEGEESYQSASQSILSFEPTVDSFAMDDVSAQGTEIDVKDFKLDIPDIILSPETKSSFMGCSRSYIGGTKQPFFLIRSPSADQQPTYIEPRLGSRRAPLPGLPKPWKKLQASDQSAAPLASIAAPSFPTIEFPVEISPPRHIERFSIVPTVETNTGTDSRSPNDVMDVPGPAMPESNLKSLTKSLADLMEYAIFQSPAPAPVRAAPPTAPISALQPSRLAQIPSVLEPDDATSVGDLTATTYEMQVDIDELKRQIEQNEHSLIKPIGHRPFGGHAARTDNYFSDYERQNQVSTLDLYDAMEASMAKQLAEGCSGARPKR